MFYLPECKLRRTRFSRPSPITTCHLKKPDSRLLSNSISSSSVTCEKSENASEFLAQIQSSLFLLIIAPGLQSILFGSKMLSSSTSILVFGIIIPDQLFVFVDGKHLNICAPSSSTAVGVSCIRPIKAVVSYFERGSTSENGLASANVPAVNSLAESTYVPLIHAVMVGLEGSNKVLPRPPERASYPFLGPSKPSPSRLNTESGHRFRP